MRTRTEIRCGGAQALMARGAAGMMPDLGKYAVAVLGSYAATIVLVAALVALSYWQRARAKRFWRGRGTGGAGGWLSGC